MPKYKCTVTVSVTTVKEETEEIEIDAPDEVTAEEDARTAAELIDEDTWDTNPNQSDSYIEGFDVGDIEIEESKESLKEDDEIDDYNQFIKKTTSKDFQDFEKDNDSDSQLLKEEEDNFELEEKKNLNSELNNNLDALEIKSNTISNWEKNPQITKPRDVLMPYEFNKDRSYLLNFHSHFNE